MTTSACICITACLVNGRGWPGNEQMLRIDPGEPARPASVKVAQRLTIGTEQSDLPGRPCSVASSACRPSRPIQAVTGCRGGGALCERAGRGSTKPSFCLWLQCARGHPRRWPENDLLIIVPAIASFSPCRPAGSPQVKGSLTRMNIMMHADLIDQDDLLSQLRSWVSRCPAAPPPSRPVNARYAV